MTLHRYSHLFYDLSEVRSAAPERAAQTCFGDATSPGNDASSFTECLNQISTQTLTSLAVHSRLTAEWNNSFCLASDRRRASIYYDSERETCRGGPCRRRQRRRAAHQLTKHMR